MPLDIVPERLASFTEMLCAQALPPSRPQALPRGGGEKWRSQAKALRLDMGVEENFNPWTERKQLVGINKNLGRELQTLDISYIKMSMRFPDDHNMYTWEPPLFVDVSQSFSRPRMD